MPAGDEEQQQLLRRFLTEANADLQQLQQSERAMAEQQCRMQEKMQQERVTAEKATAAAARELKRAQASADRELAQVQTLLATAQAGEVAALADAAQARTAHASCRRELLGVQQQLQQAREQLAGMAGLRGQLAELQAALTLRQQQQAHCQAAAASEACSRKQQSHALQQELSSCRSMLAEAQQDMARMEADSRQLQALRRSGTLTVHMQDAHACSSPGSRIPAPPCSSSGQHAARPCTADPRGPTPARPGARPMTADPSGSVQGGRRVNVLSLVHVPPLLRLSDSGGAPHSPDASAGSPASAGRQRALAGTTQQSCIGLGSPHGVCSPRRSTAAPSVVLQPAQWQAAGDATAASGASAGSAGAPAASCVVRRHSSSCSSGSATPSQARRRSSTATGAAAAAVAGLVPLLQACSPRRPRASQASDLTSAPAFSSGDIRPAGSCAARKAVSLRINLAGTEAAAS